MRSREELNCGISRSARHTAFTTKGRKVSFVPAASASARWALRKLSSSVTSAVSNWVTWGTVTQLRCRLAAESLRTRFSGWSSVGPNLEKSISGGRATETPAIATPAALPLASAPFT